MMGDWHWSGAGWVGLLLVLVFLAMILVGIVLLVRGGSSRGQDHHAPGYGAPTPRSAGRSQTALEILDERYARGEIDREEFLARKKDLGG